MEKILPLPDSDPVYYQDPNLLESESSDDRVFHGFFTRKNGVSSGIYAGLNCGVGSEDDPSNVHENRVRAAQEACVPEAHLLSLYQIHSATCLIVDDPWAMAQRPEADAFVTDKPGIGLGILTADCAPVLFYGEKSNGAPVIGAAHAGWKGALGGMLQETVLKMKALGAESIRACVGPCIGKRSYEVSLDFIQAFLDQDPAYEDFFHATQKEGHALFDLAGFCAARLHDAGLKHITVMDKDTYALDDEFYSYRRKTRRNEPDYGRQISLISIVDK